MLLIIPVDHSSSYSWNMFSLQLQESCQDVFDEFTMVMLKGDSPLWLVSKAEVLSILIIITC